MKKNIKYILSLVLTATLALSFVACKNEKQQEKVSSSMSTSTELENPEKSGDSSKDKQKTEASESSSAEETLTFSLGNDIGRNISSLQIKPSENTSWTKIDIGNVWASGYIIPVTLSAENMPEDGTWEIKVVYEEDKTEKTYENVKITQDSELILTEDEVIS